MQVEIRCILVKPNLRLSGMYYRRTQGPAKWRVFLFGSEMMNLYVYSDESGVFDKYHNDIYVFGGIMFLDKESKDIASRKYIHLENLIREKKHYRKSVELKASGVTVQEKYQLYRSLNQYYKFGVVVEQSEVYDSIFKDKKDKQRYLDYAYKIAIKHFFEYLIQKDILCKDENLNIHFFVDEHTTATNGKYELKQALESELKRGTYNYNYSTWYPPLFDNLHTLSLSFCNSSTTTLVRAADMIANNIYYKARTKDASIYEATDKLHVIKLP